MPQIQVWINNDSSANTEKLVKALNDAVIANKGKSLKAFFIFVDSSGNKIEPTLTEIAKKTNSQDVALAYISPTNYAIKAYKVNLDPSVKNTIMFYRDKKITETQVNLVANDKGMADLKSAIGNLVK